MPRPSREKMRAIMRKAQKLRKGGMSMREAMKKAWGTKGKKHRRHR